MSGHFSPTFEFDCPQYVDFENLDKEQNKDEWFDISPDNVSSGSLSVVVSPSPADDPVQKKINFEGEDQRQSSLQSAGRPAMRALTKMCPVTPFVGEDGSVQMQSPAPVTPAPATPIAVDDADDMPPPAPHLHGLTTPTPSTSTPSIATATRSVVTRSVSASMKKHPLSSVASNQKSVQQGGKSRRRNRNRNSSTRARKVQSMMKSLISLIEVEDGDLEVYTDHLRSATLVEPLGITSPLPSHVLTLLASPPTEAEDKLKRLSLPVAQVVSAVEQQEEQNEKEEKDDIVDAIDRAIDGADQKTIPTTTSTTSTATAPVTKTATRHHQEEEQQLKRAAPPLPSKEKLIRKMPTSFAERAAAMLLSDNTAAAASSVITATTTAAAKQQLPSATSASTVAPSNKKPTMKRKEIDDDLENIEKMHVEKEKRRRANQSSVTSMLMTAGADYLPVRSTKPLTLPKSPKLSTNSSPYQRRVSLRRQSLSDLLSQQELDQQHLATARLSLSSTASGCSSSRKRAAPSAAHFQISAQKSTKKRRKQWDLAAHHLVLEQGGATSGNEDEEEKNEEEGEKKTEIPVALRSFAAPTESFMRKNSNKRKSMASNNNNNEETPLMERTKACLNMDASSSSSLAHGMSSVATPMASISKRMRACKVLTVAKSPKLSTSTRSRAVSKERTVSTEDKKKDEAKKEGQDGEKSKTVAAAMTKKKPTVFQEFNLSRSNNTKSFPATSEQLAFSSLSTSSAFSIGLSTAARVTDGRKKSHSKPTKKLTVPVTPNLSFKLKKQRKGDSTSTGEEEEAENKNKFSRFSAPAVRPAHNLFFQPAAPPSAARTPMSAIVANSEKRAELRKQKEMDKLELQKAKAEQELQQKLADEKQAKEEMKKFRQTLVHHPLPFSATSTPSSSRRNSVCPSDGSKRKVTKPISPLLRTSKRELERRPSSAVPALVQ